jgi:sulfonate transport system substrate-binding protein
VVIRFADPGNGTGGTVFAYAKRAGSFDQALARVNARIEWIPGAQAFSANFDAMNAGAINTSGSAISPIVGALAHNLRFKIFSISDRSKQLSAGIVVPKDSPIRSVKDLAGRRVGVNLAAHGDYVLLKALTKEGVPFSAVERVPIQPPDAAAAFAAGKLDAWSAFGVYYNSAKRNGARVLVDESELESDDVTVIAASAEVLERNPAAFQVLIEAANELAEQARREPEKFQNVFTDKGPTAISGDELRIATEVTRALPSARVPNAGDRERVGKVARLLREAGSIDRDVPVDEIVYDLDAAVRRGRATP